MSNKTKVYLVSEKEPSFNTIIEAKKGVKGKWEKVKRTYQGDKPEYNFPKEDNGFTHWRYLL
jgi:hypothetical protein